MARIRIVTDSTADLEVDAAKDYGIEIVPLKVHFGEEIYYDGVTLDVSTFYQKLQQADKLPTTSQPSPADFLERYKKIHEEDPEAEILSIHISSVMSGTYQSAVLAQSLVEDEMKVTLLDSKSACFGLGTVVLEAAKIAADGGSLEDCVKAAQRAREQMSLYFLVDTLEYLKKGGRIGKAAALVGGLLNIKPILSIDKEGEVASVDKVRGQNKAMDRIVARLREKHPTDRPLNIRYAHSKSEEYVGKLREKVEAEFKAASVEVTSIGPVIGTHVGPGAVSVLMYPVSES